MQFPCSRPSSPAFKRYNSGIFLSMAGYVLAVFGTSTLVHRHHPHGAEVYLLAAIPALCILAMLIVIAIYLRDEKDEYQRMLCVRSLLWATFVNLALGAYNDMLASYHSDHTLPPFTQFVTFFLTFGLVQAVQQMRKGNSDE